MSKNLPSTLNLEINNIDNLLLPVTVFLDRADYVVKLNLYSYTSADGQNYGKPSFTTDVAISKTLYNLHPSVAEYVYGVFLYNKDLPRANIYTGKINIYDKADLANPVSEIALNIQVKDDLWNSKTTIGTPDGYMTRNELLEATYMVNHRTLLPIDTKDCKNGVITYQILDCRKKYVIVSNRQTGSHLPAGAYYKVFDAVTNRPIKLANYQDKLPINDYLEFMDVDSKGLIKAVANSEIVANGANKSVAIIYGIPNGQYYLKGYVNNEDYTGAINFTF
jgi:hypothetical protein